MTTTIVFFKEETGFLSKINWGKKQNQNKGNGNKFDPNWLWFLLLIPAYFWWQSQPSTSTRNPVITYPITAEDMYVSEVKALAQVYKEVHNEIPKFKNAFTDDDLKKLNKVIMEPGSMLTDLSLLQWALNALNRFTGEIADAIHEKLCTAVPRLCGGSQVATEEPTATVDPLTISLDDLNLSVRAYKCVKATGSNTIGDVVKIPVDKFLRYKGCGKKTYVEISETFWEDYKVEWRE